MTVILSRDFFDHMDTASIEFGRPVHESASFVRISAAGCDGDGAISWCAGGRVGNTEPIPRRIGTHSRFWPTAAAAAAAAAVLVTFFA